MVYKLVEWMTIIKVISVIGVIVTISSRDFSISIIMNNFLVRSLNEHNSNQWKLVILAHEGPNRKPQSYHSWVNKYEESGL